MCILTFIIYFSDDTVFIAGHELFLFYDPPHLLKGIRNNFLSKDILYDGKRASWNDILYVYDLDSKSGHTRALPKLTADHVDPKKIKKMKVKVAAQVLSARTAAMLNYTHTLRKIFNRHYHTNNSNNLCLPMASIRYSTLKFRTHLNLHIDNNIIVIIIRAKLIQLKY